MSMKALIILSAFLLMIMGINACEKDHVLPDALESLENGILKGAESIQATAKSKYSPRATGFVELIWKGASKGSNKGNKPEDLQIFFDLDAHEGTDFKSPKGEIIYTVLNSDASLHREIKAKVYDVLIDPVLRKGWILATVVSDSKGCNGDGPGGHDSGCSSGGHDDSEGGCSHDDTGGDDTHDEGGCSHDDTGGDDTHDEGGCSHDDTGGDDTHDEGCSHDDEGGDDGSGCSGEDDHEGGMGGSPGGDDKGNPMSGKNCRLGQVIALKVHDVGTPGTQGDGITWKWFHPEAYKLPSIEPFAKWHNLCKKTIIGGNIVVHSK